MHGGAPGSGAPRGNQNALKHGVYTREAIAERRQFGELLRQSRALIAKMKSEKFEPSDLVRLISLRSSRHPVFVTSAATINSEGKTSPCGLEICAPMPDHRFSLGDLPRGCRRCAPSRGCLGSRILIVARAASHHSSNLSGFSGDEIKAQQQRLAANFCYQGANKGQASGAVAEAIKACPSQDPILRFETWMHVAKISRIGVERACRIGKSSHFPAISLSGPHPLAYWHLSNPVIEHVGSCVHFFSRGHSPQNISEQIKSA